MKKLLKDGRKYTFSDYLELNNPAVAIVGVFGYWPSTAMISLPYSQAYDPATIANLQAASYQIIPKVTLSSEIAKSKCTFELTGKPPCKTSTLKWPR